MSSRPGPVSAGSAALVGRARSGPRAACLGAWLVLACVGCDPPPPSTAGRPRATAQGAAIASAAAAVASGAAAARPAEDPPLPAHIERARIDTLERVPRLLRQPLVQAAFPLAVRHILEGPDEVVLYSVSWDGESPLQAMLDGTVEEQPGIVGHRLVPVEGRPAIRAWLFDGVTRPFGGMKCNEPHHALLLRRGNEAVAIAICFQCGTFAMQTTLRGVAPRRASIRWDPAFRDYLRHLLVSAGITDLSSDIRP